MPVGWMHRVLKNERMVLYDPVVLSVVRMIRGAFVVAGVILGGIMIVGMILRIFPVVMLGECRRRAEENKGTNRRDNLQMIHLMIGRTSARICRSRNLKTPGSWSAESDQLLFSRLDP
jgi:hypothetical protein